MDEDDLQRLHDENPQAVTLAGWALEISSGRKWDEMTPAERRSLDVISNTLWEICLRYVT